jgi:phosphoglycolate phosphatase-like HAD superfamily hydrolase
MRRYSAVLLDVDGTLVESNDAHAHAWVDAFAEADISVSYARIRGLIGMGGDRIVELVTGWPRDDKRTKRLGDRRAELFLEQWVGKVRPFVDTRELLLRLRAEQYRTVIATAAKTPELEKLLHAGGIADLVELKTTSSDVEESKPHPEIVEAALAKLGPVSERSRTVMIGDTPYDLEACRGADVDLIAFTTGGWPAEAFGGAVGIYDGPADLLARWADSPLAER